VHRGHGDHRHNTAFPESFPDCARIQARPAGTVRTKPQLRADSEEGGREGEALGKAQVGSGSLTVSIKQWDTV